jgi:hypothetical protein
MLDFGDNASPKIKRRREVVFIILSGFFLGTLAVLNILGISRQIDLSFTIRGARIPFIVFIGVLPYPLGSMGWPDIEPVGHFHPLDWWDTASKTRAP